MKFQTKVVCTIGPACSEQETLASMIRAGMRVARLNFSHGSHADHSEQFRRIRAASDTIGVHVAIMADLQGPKIRIGELAQSEIPLEPGDRITITTKPVEGNRQRVSTDYPEFANDVKAGDRILIDDGTIELKAETVEADQVNCTVVVGGSLKPRKGVNLPGVPLSTPSLTEKDRDDLAFAVELGVDLVAVSFVRPPNDIRQV